MTNEQRKFNNAACGIKPKGSVYAYMRPPADSFEAADSDNWFPVWFQVINDFGVAKPISEADARAHFEAMGELMPEPKWERRYF